MPDNDTNENITLSVKNLRTWFPLRQGLFKGPRFVRAVDGINFSIQRGKTLGLVGESGSGKTTAGRTILRLIPATTGEVLFKGIDIFRLSEKAMIPIREKMQVIFQDPMLSLNPRLTVESIVAEPLRVHTGLGRRQRRDEVAGLLERVGLTPDYMGRYPHEFSGGQRQRIGIARALASRPEFVVCDEPVSALDVSVQAQILNLMNDLQDQMGLTYLFIAHNLAVVEHFADEVAVMYLGRILEKADRDTFYANPLHPYTRALLSAVPKLEVGKGSERTHLEGEMPSPISPPPGCVFHTRCPLVEDRCKQEEIPFYKAGKGHLVRCWKTV